MLMNRAKGDEGVNSGHRRLKSSLGASQSARLSGCSRLRFSMRWMSWPGITYFQSIPA